MTSLVARTPIGPAIIRAPKPTDQSYVMETWVTSSLTANTRVRRSPEKRKTYRRDLNERINALLDRSETRLVIAAAPVDADIIIGWYCFTLLPTATVVHYAYVRNFERGKHIAKAMAGNTLAVRRLVYTCKGPMTPQLLTRYPQAVYMPLAEYLE